jgi:hypothetical protein
MSESPSMPPGPYGEGPHGWQPYPGPYPPPPPGEGPRGWQPYPGPYPPPPAGKRPRSPAQRGGLLLVTLIGIAAALVVALVFGFLVFGWISMENCRDHAQGRAEYAKCG